MENISCSWIECTIDFLISDQIVFATSILSISSIIVTILGVIISYQNFKVVLGCRSVQISHLFLKGKN